jgi:Arc/MetJ-type ribon-helix-helix transcriptional regulator
MEVNLPADLTQQLQTEVALGRCASVSALIQEALWRFLSEQQRGMERPEALRALRIGQAVDDAALYERVILPDRR